MRPDIRHVLSRCRYGFRYSVLETAVRPAASMPRPTKWHGDASRLVAHCPPAVPTAVRLEPMTRVACPACRHRGSARAEHETRGIETVTTFMCGDCGYSWK